MSSFSSRLTWMLLGFNLLLMVVYLSPLVDSPMSKFNMDAEVGLPAWFTQILLYTAALLAAGLASLAWQRSSPQRLGWTVVSAVLLYLSIDEGIALHELAAAPVRRALDISSGPWIFAWTIPAVFIVLGVVACLFRFWWRLPRTTQIWLAVAAGVYVTGGLGLEIISGYYWSEQNFVFNNVYRLLTALEEGLENTGVILAIFALTETLSPLKINASRLDPRV